MLVNSAMWNIWHPGRFLPRSRRVHLGKDGIVVTAERKLDERSVLMKGVHLMTLGMMFRRKEKGRREWTEMEDHEGRQGR